MMKEEHPHAITVTTGGLPRDWIEAVKPTGVYRWALDDMSHIHLWIWTLKKYKCGPCVQLVAAPQSLKETDVVEMLPCPWEKKKKKHASTVHKKHLSLKRTVIHSTNTHK